jgi:hypothetical protein
MNLRSNLVKIALKWQKKYGVAPSVVSSLSEYDAAMMIGMTEEEYSDFMQDITAVNKGYDFIHKDIKYQVKATRPSGKPGSRITRVPKAKNYDWDVFI